MGTLVGTNLNPCGSRGQRVEQHPVGGIAMSPKTANDLPRLEILGGRAKLLTGAIKECDVEMRLSGVVSIQLFQNEAFYDQRPVLSLQPNLLDLNHRRMNAIELDVGHIGRSPKRRDAAGEHHKGDAE